MRSCLSIGLICLILGVFAQNQRWVSGRYMPGFLLAHRADIKNLSAHNYGLQMDYEIDQANTAWGSHYCKPVIGFSILYYNLGKEITGHAIGGLASVKLALASGSKSDLYFTMAGGLGYLTKTFDLVENKRNQAIGSHLNGSMQFGVLAHSPIGSGINYLEYGLSISHYSNAAYKVPNLGYNIPSISIRYGFGLPNMEEQSTKTLTQNQKSLNWTATLFYGRKQVNLASPIDFTNYGLQLRGIWNRSAVSAWRLGVDYTLDKTYAYSQDNQIDLAKIGIAEQSEVAIAAGYQWRFSQVDVLAELGAYIYQPSALKSVINQRVGVVYHTTESIGLQGTLRFHEGVADFFEIGVGYTL